MANTVTKMKKKAKLHKKRANCPNHDFKIDRKKLYPLSLSATAAIHAIKTSIPNDKAAPVARCKIDKTIVMGQR